MRIYLFACAALLLSASICKAAEHVYNGYDAYYATFPDLIFNKEEKLEPALVTWVDGTELEMPSVDDAVLRFSWTGNIGGEEHFISLARDDIVLDNKDIQLRSAIKFHTGLDSSSASLGIRPYMYTGNTSYVCAEGYEGNGKTGSRYASIFIFDTKTTAAPVVYQLPALFGSCRNIRLNAKNQFVFDKAVYRNKGDPTGVVLSEYVIKNKQFVATGNKVFTQFVEPDNAFKFSILKTQSASSKK